jgi:hypothetical protein
MEACRSVMHIVQLAVDWQDVLHLRSFVALRFFANRCEMSAAKEPRLLVCREVISTPYKYSTVLLDYIDVS